MSMRSASLVAVAAAVLLVGCERPPVDVVQTGYRGTGMAQVYNPRIVEKQIAGNVAPAAVSPQVSADGPKASDVYQNVQVLGDLSVGQFTRLMTAITQWVSPEQGCAYCHQGGNFADDNLYTKVVSRRMIQMTQHINAEQKDHVGDTGVTCFTCHRGNNVPEYIWFKETGPKEPSAMTGLRQGQNIVGTEVAYASLPTDPFTKFFEGDAEIAVQAKTVLPQGHTQTIQDTEWTYGLMMHMSTSLGVNCSYCHNTRAFGKWEESSHQRTTAWHGIRMVRSLNNDYLTPLGPQYPASRIGPHGDAPKANCGTCHAGAFKPLYGAQMAADFPSLLELSGK